MTREEGKSLAPVIVCADVDPVRAARSAVRAKIVNAGQVCTSPSRFLVDRRVYDAFSEAFIDAMAAIKVGNGLEPGVQMGPMVSERRRTAVHRLVEEAVGRGAKVALGGEPTPGTGYFYPPTVLVDVPADAELLREEPFGPVAPIAAFDDLDEALSLANALPYGLAAYGGHEVPTRPEIGYRANSALTGHRSPIVRPADCSEALVAEGELVAVIGSAVRHCTYAEARAAVFGWTIGNDVSVRGWQRSDRTFWRCKNSDTFPTRTSAPCPDISR